MLSTRSTDDQRNHTRCHDIALSALETVTLAMGRITREDVVIHSNANLWHSVTHTFRPEWQMKGTELISPGAISQSRPSSTIRYPQATAITTRNNRRTIRLSSHLTSKSKLPPQPLKEIEVTPSVSTNHPQRPPKPNITTANHPSIPEKTHVSPTILFEHTTTFQDT